MSYLANRCSRLGRRRFQRTNLWRSAVLESSDTFESSLILAFHSCIAFGPLQKSSLHFIGHSARRLSRLFSFFQVSIQSRRLFDYSGIDSGNIAFAIVRHIRTIDSFRERLEAPGCVRLSEEVE